MRFLKYLPLLLFPVFAFAQNTAPVPQTFPILQPRVSAMESGLSGLIPASVSMWGRGEYLTVHAFSPNMTDGIDSVYFPTDSLDNRSGETVYWIRVDSVGTATSVTTETDNTLATADTILYVWIDKRAYGVDSTATHTVWKNAVNRNVIDALGLTWESDVAVGDQVKIVLSYDTPIAVDPHTGGMIVVSVEEYALHRGFMFTAFSDSSLPAATDTTAICIITPDTGVRLHLSWLVDVDAKSYFVIKSGITVGAATDTITILNDNYGSSNTSTAIALANPRSGNTGTVKYKRLIGSTNRAGGFARLFGHRILAPGIKYAFLVTSLSGATNATIILEFEEHPD